jgi:rhamnogalacturonyl hydrolase YesR
LVQNFLGVMGFIMENKIGNDKQLIESAINKVEKWVEQQKYCGYEPFDGLSSILRPITFNNIFAERLLQQLVRQCPVNLRPILGIKPQESTKGRGYMAWGYLKRFKVTADQEYIRKSDMCFDWLLKNTASQYTKPSWGNHFDFTSRAGRLPKHEPIIVWTSLIGQAFLDAFELTCNELYLEAASAICDWILNLPREKTLKGDCISYVYYTQSSIHNSNMLGAAMLARTAKFTRNKTALNVAKSAMEYSCSRQRTDGSWFYGEGEKTHWIDNFHTGYNLDSLKCYMENTNDTDYEDTLKKGLKFFRESFFESNGRPKYYHNRVFPVDIQCASQAIDTLAYFSGYDSKCLDLGIKVAQWTIDNMQDKRGYFYFRVLPGVKAKTPMLHWGQATMYKALSNLCLVMP